MTAKRFLFEIVLVHLLITPLFASSCHQGEYKHEQVDEHDYKFLT